MPDARHPTAPAGRARDWSDAFNTLPLEAPSADAWPRLSRHLDRRRARRLPAWLGLAAAAAGVALALALWGGARQGPRVEVVAANPDAGAPRGATAEATPVAASAPPTGEKAALLGASPDPMKGLATPVTTSAAPTTAVATRVATSTAPARQEPQRIATPAEPNPIRVARLQQESARLEALLAVARDERVGGAGAVLLADAFDAQVAGIDAALADPELDAAGRESLWQARVDALQQAAGFVSTQRLLATQGYSDALLVSVD